MADQSVRPVRQTQGIKPQDEQGFSILAIVIIILAVGAAAYFGFGNKGGRESISPSPTAVSSKSPSPSPKNQSGFSIYANARYGFELSYPQNWTYDATGSCGENCAVGFLDGRSQDWTAVVLVYPTSYIEVKDKLIGEINPSIILAVNENTLRFNNILWTNLTIREKDSTGSAIRDSYFTERDGKTYELRVSAQMLPTFKFK